MTRPGTTPTSRSRPVPRAPGPASPFDGPTSLHLFDAPTEGTGKGLLATVIALIFTGREVEATAEGSNDEEWRKRLTAFLSEGATIVLLDNLNRTLDSGRWRPY
jgi:hypothetical protein